MTFREAIEKASHARSAADSWIGIFCLLEGVIAVVAAPFTLGLSLTLLAAIPVTAAVGACATNTRRTAELTRAHLHYLADCDGLPQIADKWSKPSKADVPLTTLFIDQFK